LVAVVAVVALDAVPVKLAVIVLALKSPLASRSTIVEAPLAVAAVVLALAIVPLEMFEALIADNPDPSAVIIPALNSPDVPRNTIVEAPLAVAAVVRALAIVPLEMLLALIAVKEVPLPDMLVKVPVVPVITLPAKDPLESRATIVEAPLAEAAEVLALSKVPVVIAEALIAVRAEPLPEKDVPVIAPAANAPPASRRTIVLAPLLAEAVVLAFAIVPEAMLEALIFEPPEISPITAAVTVLAEKLPPESRETIVDAPLAEAAVVRALAIVPDEMLEALIEVMVAPAPIKFARLRFLLRKHHWRHESQW
jgi:hypothetical protein